MSIYAQGYLLGFSQLPLVLNNWRLKRPSASIPRGHWPVSLREYPRAAADATGREPRFTRLIREAARRIAFTRLMKREYESRYQVPFHDVIGPVADMAACQSAPPVPSCPGTATSIVYAGSLQVGRWQPAIEMARAVQILRQEGCHVSFVCYSLDTPRQAIQQLVQLGTILKPAVPIERVPESSEEPESCFCRNYSTPRAAHGCLCPCRPKSHSTLPRDGRSLCMGLRSPAWCVTLDWRAGGMPWCDRARSHWPSACDRRCQKAWNAPTARRFCASTMPGTQGRESLENLRVVAGYTPESEIHHRARAPLGASSLIGVSDAAAGFGATRHPPAQGWGG